MHISEGILSAPVLVVEAGLTAATVSYAIKKMDYKQMSKVAILSSTFFVASFIHIPIGLSSVHLILNGIIGILLGWSAFPAILVALTFQAVLFQFGGLTSLGVNTFNMAFPAIISFYLFHRGIKGKNHLKALILAFACGFLAVMFSAVLTAMALSFTGEVFIKIAKLILVTHLPVMFVEGILTSFCIGFLRKVRPEIFEI